MKRAGGWILGFLIIAAMLGGGWFALRKLFQREIAVVILLQSGNGRVPTDDALDRGAQFAFDEFGGRAGHFQLFFHPTSPSQVGSDNPPVAAWLGTSEAILIQGEFQQLPFTVTVFNTHPPESTGGFRITPGCEQQGRAAAAWVKKAKASRVFLIQEAASRRSESIAAAFVSKAAELGLSIEGKLYASPKPAVLDLILEARPDLIFYSGEEAPYATSHQLFSALRAKGYAGTLLMGEADPEVSFLATRPDLVDGTYLVSPFAPAPPELAARMGTTPGPHVTAGYFAMKATLEAIDRANSIDPEDLRRAAARLPYFDAQGRAALRTCALYVARNGKFEFVEILQ